MTTYVVLINFTQQGLQNVHESPHRASAFKAAARKAGVKVRSSGGVYELLAFVRKSFTGWMPTGFAGMYRRGEEFVGRENDLWQFGQRYVLETINHMGA